MVFSSLIFVFAYSTRVCWYYYGSCAFSYLFGRKSILFSAIFLLLSSVGAVFDSYIFIRITDVLLFLLSLISLFTLMKNSDRIRLLSERSGLLVIRDDFKRGGL